MARVVVIGGGPAGMMAAIAASKKHSVILIEKNEKLGKKMYISGKGRCNVTNAKDISEYFDFVPTNSDFLYSPLYSFTNIDTMEFLENRGIKLKVERGDRVFPVSDKSSDIINAFKKELENSNVEVKLNTKVVSLQIKDNIIKSVKLDDERTIEAEHFVICTGGLSYPQTGSNGEGYEFAKKLVIILLNLSQHLYLLKYKKNGLLIFRGFH